MSVSAEGLDLEPKHIFWWGLDRWRLGRGGVLLVEWVEGEWGVEVKVAEWRGRGRFDVGCVLRLFCGGRVEGRRMKGAAR